MALDITPERMQAVASRLADGGWSFSERQLYYAVCRDIETPRARLAPGELSLGVLLILVGAITGNHVALAALGALGAVLVLVGLVTHAAERRPLPAGRVLAVSFDTFHAEHVAGHTYAGLVEPAERSAGVTLDGPLVIVCDRLDTVAMLRANAGHVEPGFPVIEAGALETLAAGTRVVAIHDASPAGCAVAAEARDRGLSVADAGLNPRDVMGRRVQLIEGAPARLPRDLSGCLNPTEVDWLTRGHRVELATLSPEEVMLRVRAALRSDAGSSA